jgi:AraC family transcriptional regulator of adaptative response/methylated-DNA-[protein]-cysteine methyltransferase
LKFRRGRQSQTILGELLIAGTVDGVCAVLLGKNDKGLAARLRDEFPKAILNPETSPSAKWIRAVHSCQAEDVLFSKLPRDLRIEVFQAKIWKVLQ